MNSMKENIPVDIHYAALKRARDLTFQAELGQGTFGKGVAQALNSSPGTVIQMTAVPFFKIAVNLTKFAAVHSPMAPLAKSWRKDFMAGGIRRYEALGRLATGGALMATGLSRTGRRMA
jgi:hypothetical protein